MRFHPTAGLSLALALALLTGCTKPPAGRSEAPPAPVTVATVGKKTVSVRLHTIGAVKTVATVAVRPRVGGQITGVYFKEGDYVTEGQKLFVIDPREFNTAVKKAEAEVSKAKAEEEKAAAQIKTWVAQIDQARADLAREDQLSRAGTGTVALDLAKAALGVREAEHKAAEAFHRAAKAAHSAAEAALNTANIQLGFTTIAAPIDGRVGELLVNKGNLVEANGLNPLVIINQVSPITVAFALPEQQLPVVLGARKKGPLKVEADLRGGGPLATGELTFIDNTADPLTGTVQFKGAFENADQKLWPGLFVDVTLILGDRPDSVVVPSAALQSGQKGQYVYIVTPDKKAELRTVTVAFEADGEAIITSGLSGGETVVVEGQLRLAPGVKVDPKPLQGRPVAPPVPRVVTEGAK